MNFPVILDVAIGLVVIYFISSMVLSFIMEYVIVRRNWRGDFLYNKLKEMFYSSQGGYYNIIEKVYGHPLISKLQQYSYRKPEKIESGIFARAFMHVLVEIGEETLKNDVKELKDGQGRDGKEADYVKISTIETELRSDIAKIDRARSTEKYLDGDGKRIVDSFFLDQKGTMQTADSKALVDISSSMTEVENWFIGFQSRLDYLFQREVKWYLFIYAFVLCAALNVDTLGIYNNLINDAAKRNQLVVLGENFAAVPYDSLQVRFSQQLKVAVDSMNKTLIEATKTQSNVDSSRIQGIKDTVYFNFKHSVESTIKNVYGPAEDLIGWNGTKWNRLWNNQEMQKRWYGNTFWTITLKFLGILISAFALMFGAPFWHEYLKSMLNMRKVINPQNLLKKNN